MGEHRITSTDRKNIRAWYEHMGKPMPEPTAEERLSDITEALMDIADMAAASSNDLSLAVLELAEKIAEMENKIQGE